jgi:putative acetyltransferase
VIIPVTEIEGQHEWNLLMEIEIIEYEAQFKDDFKRLNEEWISKYFKLELPDLQQLDNPEKYILSKGGKIYLARAENQIIGTITLKKETDRVFELSKMAVAPEYQGRSVAKRLAEHLISEARQLGCKLLYLESNQKLIPALNLYKKLGFREVPVGCSPYSRADYRGEMIL